MYRDSKEDQEDLFQEIVYQLWKSYPSFRGEAKLSSWIYRIALNTAMVVYRKSRPVIDYLENYPEKIHPQSDTKTTENDERLFWALRRLSDTEKALVSLYLEDFSYAEIAMIAGISESNVGVKLNRIKAKLKVITNTNYGTR